MIYRGVKARELFGGRGIEEVVEVPLCWDCVIEMEVGEGSDRDVTFRKGLGGAERVTGGGELFMNRWDRRKEKGVSEGIPMSGLAVSLLQEC